METAIVVIALVVGLVGGYFAAQLTGRGREKLLTDRRLELEKETQGLQADLGTAREEKAALQVQADRVAAMEQALRDRDAEAIQLRAQIAEADARSREADAKFGEREQNFKDQLETLMRAKEELSKAFAEASQEVVQKNNKLFLQLADENLKKREAAVTEIVKPVRESLEKLDKQNQEIEKERVSAYSTLTEQVKSMLETQTKLQGETSNLVKALRAPHQRGRWGEIQLQRVVEMAGMVEYCDFTQQETTEGGALRPDMVVRLPSAKLIVVDSKTPLDAYLSAVEAVDEAERAAHLVRHAQQVRTHIVQLGRKQYAEQFGSVEFVVLFLPGEPFFSAALEQDPTLIEFGVDNKVIVATPTTLIALLRAVAYGWRQEQLAENAQKISETGKELYGRIAKLSDHFEKLGKSLDRAVGSYNDTVASLEGRVLPQARRFKDLQASTGEDIPAIEPIDHKARKLAAREMTALPGTSEDDSA